MKNGMCSSCKTGADFVKLDSKEPFCYYIDLFKDGECKMYVPITPSVEMDENRKTK